MKYYTDVATKNNGKYGEQESWIVVVDENNSIVLKEFIGDKTNIEGEVTAIIACLKYFRDNAISNTNIYTDSDFWVKTLQGIYRLHKEHLKPLYHEALELIYSTRSSLYWVRRDKNLAGLYFDSKPNNDIKGLDPKKLVSDESY
jgi:ribonuclease HI